MLTARQQQLLDFIRSYHRTTGVMPSTREIQQHFGFASQTAAVSHLRALERKGAIKKLAGKARALVFPEDLGRSYSFSVPVYGAIPAGFPTTADPAAADSQLAIDAALLGLSENAATFALRVRGDSMIDAHIVPGDFAIFEKREARDGDIVAALIDGETTLKRLVHQEGKAFLKAENAAYPDLQPVNELLIQGVLVGLVRAARRA
ncbi:MAG: transcriptional repressor LexA [Verrucomicrobiales bacterium]